YELLAPLGMAAYAALTVAFLTGLLKFKFRVKWINMKWHLWAAAVAMILASLHFAVVIYVNL
ncbi:MAG TPA: hypothetical protein PKV41_04965, partial [Candidatus Omnitrophota bacterium]|nr:hypothetical protein [Candidatus Omnitrophota bacterium]